jgi:hypothetical protein
LKSPEAITKFGWTVLPIHLTPSGFYVFGALKNAVRGVKFKIDDDVINAVRTWLQEQDKEWYRQGIGALVSPWRKAVEVDRDSVEK